MAKTESIFAIYDDYYSDGKVASKREIASKQSVRHIETILEGQMFERILDIGAGEGAVLDKLSCSIPDDHIDPRRSALFMARSVLREIRDGGTDACSTA